MSFTTIYTGTLWAKAGEVSVRFRRLQGICLVLSQGTTAGFSVAHVHGNLTFTKASSAPPSATINFVDRVAFKRFPSCKRSSKLLRTASGCRGETSRRADAWQACHVQVLYFCTFWATPYNPSPKTSEIVLDDIVLEWMESRKADWYASA